MLIKERFLVRVHYQIQYSTIQNNLFGGLRIFISPDSFSRSGVQNAQGRCDTERYIDPVVDCDNPPGQMARPALEGPYMRKPLFDTPLPQVRTVEGVPCHHVPSCGQVDMIPQSFVNEVEYPAV